MTAARLGLYTAAPAVTAAAKATVVRTLLRDGPSPSARFHHGRLPALRACLASRLVVWVRDAEVPTVRAGGLAAAWLAHHAARAREATRAAMRHQKRAAEARERVYGADPALARAVAAACAGMDRRSPAARALAERRGALQVAETATEWPGSQTSAPDGALLPCAGA